MNKKRTITKDDVGKMFRVYKEGDEEFVQFELVCDVKDNVYDYLCYRKGCGWHEVRSIKTTYLGYYFEEVNALTALILFGNNISKEFKGFEHDQ